MHSYFRILAAASILFAFGAISAFASGQNESSHLTGTVSTIQPVGNNMVSVVVTTASGTFTANVNQSLLSATTLKVGQTISLDGVLHQSGDGTKSVDPTDIEVDGKSYSVSQNAGQTGGQTGVPVVSEDSTSNVQDSGQSVETPETPEPPHAESPDSSGSKDSAGSGSAGDK